MATDTAAPAGRSILVVGGGISGLTSALEAAEVGYEVFLIEKGPSLGGRVSQLKQYFPKLCPPSCGLEINYRRIKDNRNITVMTLTDVEKVTGTPGNYDVSLTINPRYVNDKCTCCGDCESVCEREIPNDVNFGMDNRKAAYLPSDMAFPQKYMLAPEIIDTEDGQKCKDACKYDAIELDMQPKELNIKVGAVIWATGWTPYDAARIDNLGFGRYQNIITNMMLERIASTNGPTNGKILRPSDDKAPETIAFAQCAGSRDENHLPYCSYICCLASLKHATYIREQYPLIAEDAIKGEKVKQTVDMLVLATGMQPNAGLERPDADLKITEDGFIINDFSKGGMFAAGCANKPADVVSSNQNATGMAMKAIQTLVRR